MAVDFSSLTVKARLGPCPDVVVHSRPNEPLGDKVLSCIDSWVRQGMERIEHGTSKVDWNERTRIACADIADECSRRSQVWHRAELKG